MTHRIGSLFLNALPATCIALTLAGAAHGQSARDPQLFDIRVDEKIGAAPAGRLMVLAQPWVMLGARFVPVPPEPLPAFVRLSADPGSPYDTAVAAREIERLAPGQTLILNVDDTAYPMPFSQFPAGDFAVQAFLDVDHSNGMSPGDLTSAVRRMRLPAGERPTLVLDRVQPGYDPWTPRAPRPGEDREDYEWSMAAKARTERVAYRSPAMTAFAGRPVDIRAYVLTPPAYDPRTAQRYPVVYVMQGFGARYESTFSSVVRTYEMMARGETPHMIWVFLDQQIATGTHEFADSANNGPWGRALTTEFIPWLEARYRTDGKASGRFTTGHSSGGWAALWLQVRYPKLFGGAWPTAPDPVDFRNFTNVDIYAPNANAYRRPDGTATPLVRGRNGTISATLQQYAQKERVLGEVGGQMDSFDWVFSPKGADGRPRSLFNRETGVIDPQVAAYWRDNYDIAHRIRTLWPTLKPDLDGKIHLSVGTLDTYHLEGSARLLKATLDGLGARSDFRFVEGRGHGDLSIIGIDAFGLDKTIAWEMYAAARPGVTRPPFTPRGDRIFHIGPLSGMPLLPRPAIPVSPLAPSP